MALQISLVPRRQSDGTALVWSEVREGGQLPVLVATHPVVLETVDRGLEIARADLRLRGMGDLFGERQSGVPTFRVADPIRDEALSDEARVAAERLRLALHRYRNRQRAFRAPRGCT